MVQKSNSDLEVSNSTYINYYTMSSSPTLDSGTCSDLEASPPPLPKKKITKIKINGDFDNEQLRRKHNESLADTDSESSLSCDSLNCSDLIPMPPPLIINSFDLIPKKLKFLPSSLLKDIRDRSNKVTVDVIERPLTPEHQFNLKITKNNDCNKPYIGVLNQENVNRIFENDKFYTFHINENVNDIPDLPAIQKDNVSFAGYEDISSGTSTIRSSKGTIRGVKNRVRNGIATYLQMHHTINTKSYKDKDAGKVVLYTTSMGIIRDTYAKCANMKQILRTLLVKFEERDVFMSNELQQEIKDRMQSEYINVPQLFVDGHHIGDADFVECLNETGELRKMLKPYKCLDHLQTCELCGGYRLLPCPSCKGSKKSIFRNHFTTEFVSLRCMNCNESGLVKCYNC